MYYLNFFVTYLFIIIFSSTGAVHRFNDFIWEAFDPVYSRVYLYFITWARGLRWDLQGTRLLDNNDSSTSPPNFEGKEVT